MDSNDERKEHHPFPKNLEYVEEIVSEARKKTELIDKQLDQTAREFEKPKPHMPRYNPPSFLKSAKQNNPINVVYNLEKQKMEIEAGLNTRIEREIDALGLDDATASQLREATFHKMNPNTFAGKSDREMESLQKSEKDMNYSQDYMRQLRTNFKAKDNTEKASPETPKTSVKKEDNSFSISTQFTQSLSYTKVQESKSPELSKWLNKNKITPAKE